MKKNRFRSLLALLITTLLIAGCSRVEGNGLSDSSSAAQKTTTTEDEVQKLKDQVAQLEADRELDILLNKSELEGLDLVDGPIYVTGHKSPDSDTVCSAIAYAGLLKKLGYDAQPVVLGKISNETKYILETAGVEEPPLLDDAAGLNMVLVDHSEYKQSADGLKDAHVISIIDHHGDGNVTTGNQLVYDARPLGATATIIWIRYRNYGVEMDSQTATLLLGALLSDTKNMKANSCSADREALKYLSETAGIPDTDAFYNKIFEESLSYDGFTDEEIFCEDMKQYTVGERAYLIGVISLYDEEDAPDMAARMNKVMPSVAQSYEADMAFAQITVFHDDKNVNFIVPSNEAARDALSEAFPDAEYKDGMFILRPGISRKKVLVPALSDVLSAYPSE